MKTTAKPSREEMARRHESPDFDAFGGRNGKWVEGVGNAGTAPISIRLSRPLLDAIDRLATSQHRKRSNLIQHILWEYLHAHEAGSGNSGRAAGARRRG